MPSLDAESWLIARVCIAMEVLVTLSCLGRFLARWQKRLRLEWDDGWIVVAWVLYTTYFSLVLQNCKHPGVTLR